MSECKRVRELLALRPDDWDAAERRRSAERSRRSRVETHLATCADCANRARAYAKQDRLVRSTSRVRLTAAQRDQLLSHIQQERTRYEMHTKLVTALSTTMAVVALIGLTLGLYTMFRGENQPITGGPVATRVVSTEEPALTPLVFAGEIRGNWQSLDPLTGKPDPLYFGGPNVPEDRSTPGQLSVPVDLSLMLNWQVVAPPSADWRVFVHMLNEAGEVVMQSDVAVDWPDQTCLESEYDLECTVTSEHQWYFPADLPRGLYTIVAGLYDPETGERAPLTGPAGAMSPVTLGQVWVVDPAQATLRVFSGRLNPTWTLTPTQTTELQARLASLSATDQPFDDSGGLGYSGFVLLQPAQTDTPAQTILVDRGIVRIESGDQVTLWIDPDRSIERWLLETAAGQVEEAVIESVRQEIDALVIHVVREGDTLQSIAARYGVSAEELLKTNDLGDPATLRVGYALLIPRLSLSEESRGFAIYLVADESTAVCEGTPILSLDDIRTYDWDTHAMTLTGAAHARLGRLNVPVAPGVPFVACVDDEPIYTGAFWTPLSSASSDGIVIEVLPTTENRPLRIQLGYPEAPELFTGADLRGDPRIFQSLEAAGKLLPWP